MQRTMFLAKIHRAVITQADPDYEGSVTIDEDLMDAAGILVGEAVHIWNVTQGSRLMTYALKGPRGSGVICANGAAAKLNNPGDCVILATFGQMSDQEARRYHPRVVRVDDKNRILSSAPEVPGPSLPKELH